MTHQDPGRELLLACCQADPDQHLLAGLLERAIDWQSLTRRAIALGVGPILHAQLRGLSSAERVPEVSSRALASAYLTQASQNARAHDRLEETLAVLAAAGIDAVVLKGAALAEPVYGDLALRRMVDLDLLVREADAPAANRIMRKRGYTPYEGWRPDSWYEEVGFHHLAPLVAPDKAVTIELHRHIIPVHASARFSIDELWERVQATRIGGTDARTLCPTDTLLHLAVHQTLSSSFVGQLRTLCDIAIVTARLGEFLDWDALVERAGAAGAARYVFYPLHWARTLVAAACPTEVLDGLSSIMGRLGNAHRILDRTAQDLICRSPADTGLAPAWLWDALLAELLESNATTGIRAIARVARRHLMRSARRTAPGLGPLLPLYALTLHPLVGVARALARRSKRRGSDSAPRG